MNGCQIYSRNSMILHAVQENVQTVKQTERTSDRNSAISVLPWMETLFTPVSPQARVSTTKEWPSTKVSTNQYKHHTLRACQVLSITDTRLTLIQLYHIVVMEIVTSERRVYPNISDVILSLTESCSYFRKNQGYTLFPVVIKRRFITRNDRQFNGADIANLSQKVTLPGTMVNWSFFRKLHENEELLVRGVPCTPKICQCLITNCNDDNL